MVRRWDSERMLQTCRAVAVELTRRKGGPVPSYKELGEAVGVRPEAAWRAVKRLEEAGMVRRGKGGRDRAIQVLIPWLEEAECGAAERREARRAVLHGDAPPR